jgi:hypothetical protein
MAWRIEYGYRWAIVGTTLAILLAGILLPVLLKG